MASLLKNVAGQNITFCMVSASTGAATAGVTVTVKVVVDTAAQASGGGSVTDKTNGQYSYQPTQAETNGADCGFLFTGTGMLPVNADFHTDPTNWGALNIDSFGNVGVQSNYKKNTACGIPFVMTDSTNHQPKTGLTVSAFRVIDNGSFAAATNATATEIANGWYFHSASAGDMNGNKIGWRFVATGADDLDLAIDTTP